MAEAHRFYPVGHSGPAGSLCAGLYASSRLGAVALSAQRLQFPGGRSGGCGPAGGDYLQHHAQCDAARIPEGTDRVRETRRAGPGDHVPVPFLHSDRRCVFPYYHLPDFRFPFNPGIWYPFAVEAGDPENQQGENQERHDPGGGGKLR